MSEDRGEEKALPVTQQDRHRGEGEPVAVAGGPTLNHRSVAAGAYAPTLDHGRADGEGAEGPDAPEFVVMLDEEAAAPDPGVVVKPKATRIASRVGATSKYVDFSRPADSLPEVEGALPEVSKKGAL